MPKVSIIIPSLDGYRNGNVPRLLADLKRQTFKDFEVHVIKGVVPNGRARNVGAKKAKGDIFVFIDDDVEIGSDDLIEKLIEPLFRDSSIGLIGPSFTMPKDSNKFQRYLAKQLPRSEFIPKEDMLETDMVTHACMAITAKLFWQIGGENEILPRGSDPDLRYRIRQKGFKIVGRKGIFVYHPVPENLIKLIEYSFFAGLSSGISFRLNPDLIYDVAQRPDFKENYVTNKGLPYRIFRAFFRLFKDLVSFNFLLFISHIFNAVGYIVGLLFKKS